MGVQPQRLLPSQVHAAPVPHSVVEPWVQRLVQKCVFGSPKLEQRLAVVEPKQSVSDAQYLPIPSSLPTSPGLPQSDAGASAALPSTEFCASTETGPALLVQPMATTLDSRSAENNLCSMRGSFAVLVDRVGGNSVVRSHATARWRWPDQRRMAQASSCAYGCGQCMIICDAEPR